MNKGEIVDSFVDNRINEEENITGSVIKEGDKYKLLLIHKK